ncbi:MAG: serine hydrolase [Microgenomates group bacterium]
MAFQPEQQAIPQIKPLLKKPKRPRLTNSDRLVIVAVFLLTVITSGFFYFQTQIGEFFQKIRKAPLKITSPLVITGGREVKRFDPTPVLEEIKNLTKDLLGTYGVYVYRFEDGQEYGLHQKEIFPAASLMKLPVILTLYQEAEAGKISLETRYKLLEADKRGGAGILQSRPAGEVYTYRKLAELMGQYSDNTANNVLVKILGQQKIQQTIDNLGMKKTNFTKYETTPEDIGIFFRKLYQGKIVNQVNQGEILKFLTKTGFEDRIPAGVPEGVRVAHKIGTEIGVFSDGGIVFGEDPFVLVILSKNARESEAKEVLPKITRAVWEWENSK